MNDELRLLEGKMKSNQTRMDVMGKCHETEAFCSDETYLLPSLRREQHSESQGRFLSSLVQPFEVPMLGK